MINKPLVSIITVVFNGEQFLEETIKSVINQSYDNVEYIIIDGGSTDGTVDIIKKYEDQISYWVSEKDEGIYDAMNKGIEIANGKWINFMNAGDIFFDKKALKKVRDIIKKFKEPCVIYGDVIVKHDNKNQKLVRAGSIKNFYKGMPFCHQSSFVLTNEMKENNFNTNFKVCADFNFFLDLYVKDKKFKYINETISICDANGVSSNVFQLYSDKRKIALSENKWYLFYYMYLYLEYTFRTILKKILPTAIVEKIQMMSGKKIVESKNEA